MTALFAFLLTAAARAAEPSLILHHGKIFLAPGHYAQAVAVSENRVSAVGKSEEIIRLKGPKTKVIDLQGRAVTPGFHDAHVHFFKGALFLTQADLNGAASVAEIQKRLLDYLQRNPQAEWVLGRGWDHTAFADQKYPARQDLDAVISTRPVALTDVDGHKLWLNSEALRRARIPSAAAKPGKGEIVRNEKGEPTGILIDDAMRLAEKAIPRPDRKARMEALRKALALARRYGVTSVDSLPGIIDTPPEEQLDLWRELYQRGEFTLRFFLYGRLEDPEGFAKLKKEAFQFPRNRLSLIGLKGFVDGVISARSAALLEPYFDDPKTRGEPKYPAGKLNALVRAAHRAGFQVALHAIGDRAVRMALDACQASEEGAKEKSLILPAFPCRIEHIEVADPSDLPRFKELKVAASMQPSHMTYDNEIQNYNPERLGERVRGAFAWKSLEEAGATLAFGTDWPVMPLEPRIDLFAAATRQHFNGKPPQGWVPREKITLESAIEHYTLGPARAIGLEEELGSIVPGKLADLVVFDRDLFAVSGLELLKVEVDLTVFDGKVVYERGKGAR